MVNHINNRYFLYKMTLKKSKLEQALDFRDHYEEKVRGAAEDLRKRKKLTTVKPVFGIVLGSGLGELGDVIEDAIRIPYSEIPNFPIPTVSGHEGTLLIGTLEGVPVIGLNGRKHYYEVADEPLNTGILQTVFPVHVLAELGVRNYFVTNAAGGLNSEYGVGDIMIIRSHINFLPNPLLGRHHKFLRVDDARPALRFQPMNSAYDPALRQMLHEAGSDYREHIHEGTYLGVTGPTYETEGESIAFRDGLKADAVGMSTTPEVIIARNRGMQVVGMSCITNEIAADGTNTTDHTQVEAILKSPQVKERLSSTARNFFRIYRESALLRE